MVVRVTGNRIRCAIYVRISKDKTGEALGVARQEEDCRELAARLEWEVFDVYRDNDLSAYSGKPRPAYRQMLDDIQGGKIDAVIAWDTSRLYRQLRDLLELIDLFDEYGLKSIATVNAGDIDLSTSAGRTNAIILGKINQQYSEDTRDKIKRKKRELAERGLPSGGGIRHFGFTGTGKQKVSRLRALQEQELIREAVDYLLTGGTIIGLVKDWKRRGIKTVNGGQWRSSHVRTMLLSPAIAGKTQYNGQYFDAKERVNDEWVPVSPIVPFEKWQRLRDLLTDPARTMTKGANNQKYLLTGVLRCGLCGGRMAGTIKRRYVDGKSISAQRIYNCPLSMGGCNRINRQADAVEGLILKAIFQAVESPTWDARVRESSSDDDAVQQLLERRAEVTGLLDRLQDKLARELIGEPAYRRNRVELEDELAAINRQLSRLQDDSVVPAVPRNLRQVWDDLAFDRQRSIIAVVLRATGRRLVVYPQANRWFDPDSVKLEPVEAPA